jgi:DNA-binding response OmpR family regulator
VSGRRRDDNCNHTPIFAGLSGERVPPRDVISGNSGNRGVRTIGLPIVTSVLIASDSVAVAAEVQSVLPAPAYSTRVVTSGPDVLKVARRNPPDLIVLDFQIGNMGGMATCMDIRLDTSAGRPDIPVLLLLDRRADVFLARRANASGWVIKPTDPIRLRKAVQALLAGSRYEDSSYTPNPVVVPSTS